MKKIAALDLGTNSFLCLIAQRDSQGKIETVKDLVEIVKLGQGVSDSNKFHPDALQRAELCLKNFKLQCDLFGVSQIAAVATSAARDVTNGNLLFEMGQDLGIPIRIIEGQEEASLTFKGATLDLDIGFDKNYLVIDIGGGSTELILGNRKGILFSKSLQLGAVRFTEKYIRDYPVSKETLNILKKEVDLALAAAILEIGKHSNHSIDTLIAVAGTPTALAAASLGEFDPVKVNGFILTNKDLEQWIEIFSNTSIEEKALKYKLGKRADVILAGTVILSQILTHLNHPEIQVSTKGVRYGLADEMLSKD